MLVFDRVKATWLRLAIMAVLMWAIADSKHYHTFMGPFTLNVRRMEACPKELRGKGVDSAYYFRDVRTHYKQNPTFSGNLSLTYTVSEHLGGRMTLASWSNNGGWKENAHSFKKDGICGVVRLVAHKIWDAFTISVLGQTHKPCFIYPGIYRYENVSVDATQFGGVAVKQFIYGRWRADLQSYDSRTQEVLGCVRVLADTIPA